MRLFAPRDLGRRGERRAAWFYRLRGWTIVARNLRLPAGEIDLVVQRFGMVAIVEVKTRQSLAAGQGYDAVDRRKRERLILLGDQYLARNPGVQLRYDIVSLFWTGWRFELTHFPDAFRPIADARYPWKWRV